MVDFRPTPFATEKFVAPPGSVHAPPMSAVPNPLFTVRANVSLAYIAGRRPVTVTCPSRCPWHHGCRSP